MQFTIAVVASIATAAFAAPAPVAKRAAGSGDMTYYETGLGSCGFTNTDSDLVVALSPADSPASLCGQSITITYNGVTATGTVVDTCPGCAQGSIDVTSSLFQQFAGLDAGRLNGVTWSV